MTFLILDTSSNILRSSYPRINHILSANEPWKSETFLQHFQLFTGTLRTTPERLAVQLNQVNLHGGRVRSTLGWGTPWTSCLLIAGPTYEDSSPLFTCKFGLCEALWVLDTNLGLVKLCLSLLFCLSAHCLLILLQGHIRVWWTAGIGVGRTLRTNIHRNHRFDIQDESLQRLLWLKLTLVPRWNPLEPSNSNVHTTGKIKL